jgi:PIN domain nuclease of toxin-antitoxin system
VRLLLDTHTLFWYIDGSPQLTATAQRLIQDAKNDILISPASYWEIAIKISLGKWQLNRAYDVFIDIALNQYGFRVLPILPAHTAALIELPFHHRDPFDRLLAAQALVEGIPLVSTDAIFDQYGVNRLWTQATPSANPDTT